MRHETITVNLTARDAGSGVGTVALGGDWQVQAGDFAASAGAQGQLVTDTETASGLALALPPGASSTWQTSFIDPLPVNTVYEAYVRLKYQPAGADSGAPIAHIALVDPYYPSASDPAPVSFLDLRQGDFRQAGAYQEFTMDFMMEDNGNPDQDGRLQARITASGGTALTLDRVRILYGPQPYAAQMPYLLEPQAEPQTVVAKILDAAGNPSADLVNTTQWYTTAQTSEWELISPTTWVSSTAHPTVVARVTGAINALVAPCISPPTSNCAAVRYSTDGGIDWSALQNITPTGVSGSASELSFVWPGGQGTGPKRVEFWVGSGGTDSYSPHWQVQWPVRFGSVPPAQTTVFVAPTVMANVPFTVWSASDSYGVVSYDVRTSPDQIIWQDWLSSVPATSAQHGGVGSGTLYIEARARNAAGNVGPWSAPQSVTVDGHAGFVPLVVR